MYKLPFHLKLKKMQLFKQQLLLNMPSPLCTPHTSQTVCWPRPPPRRSCCSWSPVRHKVPPGAARATKDASWGLVSTAGCAILRIWFQLPLCFYIGQRLGLAAWYQNQKTRNFQSHKLLWWDILFMHLAKFKKSNYFYIFLA